jgi:hydroxymethylpyrimidine pyrophosphatase-like HAD family hydrolase
MRFDVVATDLDRTFSREDLDIDPQALEAVADLRRAGILAILATGRTEGEVALKPGLAGAFDCYVLECGARVGRWGALRDAHVPLVGLDGLCADLKAAGVEVWRGPMSASVARADEGKATGLAVKHGVTALPNRDRIDLVPAGIDKGVGLAKALELLAPGRRLRVVAIGDGENDMGLLRAADHRVAVANATQGLIALAHEVTPHPAAAGFRWLVRNRVLQAAPDA